MKTKIVILMMMLMGWMGLSAQGISVTSFKPLPNDLTANLAGTQVKDQNGEVAALIKVVTTQTGFTFEGGMAGIVKTKQEVGEIWVYVPHGIQKITIKHPQLGVLRDYFFPCAIDAARTYEMVLASGEVRTVVTQDAGGSFLALTVEPKNASVYINGEKKCDIQPGNIVKLPMNPGQYSLRCVSLLNPAMFIFIYVELLPGHEKLQFINLAPQQKPYNQPRPQQQAPRQGSYRPTPQPRKKKKDRTALIVIGCVVGFLLLCFIVGFIIGALEDSSSSYDYNYEEPDSVAVDTVAVDTDTDTYSPRLYPYYDSESGLYGYKNSDGEVMYIPPFEEASTLDNDTVTIVKKDGVYLYFTVSGYLYEIADSIAY